MKKICMKVISVLMVLSMIAGVCAPVVQGSAVLGNTAEYKGDEIYYVSLGDSMTNGYGFEGYRQGGLGDGAFIGGGEGIYGYAAYPNQFADWLENTYYGGRRAVNHIQLASSAMRAEDLLFLLGGREMPTDGWFDEVNFYTGERDNAKLSAYYQESIEKADVITMGIGNASFGAYLVQYITRALGVMGGSLEDGETVTLADALALLDDPEQERLVLDVYNRMMGTLLTQLPSEATEQYRVDVLCDAMAYITAGFLLNYRGVIERIMEINPDAEVILVGLMNTTYGIEITAENMEPIALGDLMDEVFGLLNTYIAGLPAVMQAMGVYREAKFYYAELSHPKFIVQSFDDMAQAGWTNVDCGEDDCGAEGHICEAGRLSADVVRARSIEAYNDNLRYMIGAAMNMDLPAVTLADVKAYTGGYSSYDQAVINREISTAIYLAIEDAVVASVDTMEIPLDGLANIAGDLSSVFTDMPDALNPANNPTPSIIRKALGDHLTSTATLKGMCKVYGFFKIGNGMSVHPTPAGHDDLFEAMKTSYAEGHTAMDKTISDARRILQAAGELFAAYDDEIYAYAYDYAVENGYVAAAVAAIERVIAAMEALELTGVGMTAALEAALRAELDAIAAVLRDMRNILMSESAAIRSELIEALLALEARLYRHLDNIKALLTQEGDSVAEWIGNVLEDTLEMLRTEATGAVRDVAEIMAECLARVRASMSGEYVVSEDSYYVAITGGSNKYAALLADSLGLEKNQFANLRWEELDAQFDMLARADLITVGYGEQELWQGAYAQILGYVCRFLDDELRGSAAAYAHTVADKMFGDMLTEAAVATVPAAVDRAVGELLASDLFAEATDADMDWTAIVGKDKLPYVDRVRAELKSGLAASGIPETVPVSINVVDYLFANASDFGDDVANLLRKIDRKKVEAKLGEDQFYTVQVPVADLAAFTVEACLYHAISFHLYYNTTIQTIRETNPDAEVVILGCADPLGSLPLTVGSLTSDIGEAYRVVAGLSSINALACAVEAEATYVGLSDVETVYQQSLAEGEEPSFAGFISACLADPTASHACDRGHESIRDQILGALAVTCIHTYGHTCTDAACDRCGELREIPGHDFGVYTPDGNAACTADGTKTAICERCGETDTVADEGSATGHSFTSYLPDGNATCTEDGTKTAVCDVCGMTDTVTDEGSATGHLPGSEATCTEAQFCEVCKAELAAAVGHDWSECVVTCTHAPQCAVCGIYLTPPKGHTWEEATCRAPKTCTECGETEGEALSHTYANACDADCDECGSVRTPAEHAYGDWTVVAEATKKAEGKQERSCSVCGYTVSESIPALEGCGSVLGCWTVLGLALLGAFQAVRRKKD